MTPTDQLQGPAGAERVVMSAGAVERQAAYAATANSSRRVGRKVRTSRRARGRDRWSGDPAAWLKKRL